MSISNLTAITRVRASHDSTTEEEASDYSDPLTSGDSARNASSDSDSVPEMGARSGANVLAESPQKDYSETAFVISAGGKRLAQTLVDRIVANETVRNFEFSNCPDDIVADFLRKLPEGITGLNLSLDASAARAAVETIRAHGLSLASIASLSISGETLKAGDVRTLMGACTRLTSLQLQHMKIEGKDAKAVAALQNLEELDLRTCSATVDTVKAILGGDPKLTLFKTPSTRQSALPKFASKFSDAPAEKAEEKMLEAIAKSGHPLVTLDVANQKVSLDTALKTLRPLVCLNMVVLRPCMKPKREQACERAAMVCGFNLEFRKPKEAEGALERGTVVDMTHKAQVAMLEWNESGSAILRRMHQHAVAGFGAAWGLPDDLTHVLATQPNIATQTTWVLDLRSLMLTGKAVQVRVQASHPQFGAEFWCRAGMGHSRKLLVYHDALNRLHLEPGTAQRDMPTVKLSRLLANALGKGNLAEVCTALLAAGLPAKTLVAALRKLDFATLQCTPEWLHMSLLNLREDLNLDFGSAHLGGAKVDTYDFEGDAQARLFVDFGMHSNEKTLGHLALCFVKARAPGALAHLIQKHGMIDVSAVPREDVPILAKSLRNHQNLQLKFSGRISPEVAQAWMKELPALNLQKLVLQPRASCDPKAIGHLVAGCAGSRTMTVHIPRMKPELLQTWCQNVAPALAVNGLKLRLRLADAGLESSDQIEVLKDMAKSSNCKLDIRSPADLPDD
jgi:hypothetical protein